MDIYKTHTMLMAVRNIAPVTKFLRDRYFPTNDVTDIFATSDVLVDYMDGSKKLAPFVVPRKGGVAVTRKGYTTKRYAPPFIAPKRELTIDDLMRRDFGEAWYSRQTPGERQVALMMRDFDELEAMISRREEAMAAEVLLTNGCVMNHIADDLDEPVVAEIHYYDGDENDAVYTPTTAWNATGATILQDIAAAAELLSARGLPATDLIVSADVGMAILADETILKQLDNRRLQLGDVTPERLPNGVTAIARLNAYGHIVTVYSYGETYTSDAGTDTPYLPSGTAIITAPNCGRTVYGAVTQIDQEDGAFRTYAERRVPKYYSDAANDIRELYLRCRPLMIPNHKNAWITIDAFKTSD